MHVAVIKCMLLAACSIVRSVYVRVGVAAYIAGTRTCMHARVVWTRHAPVGYAIWIAIMS